MLASAHDGIRFPDIAPAFHGIFDAGGAFYAPIVRSLPIWMFAAR